MLNLKQFIPLPPYVSHYIETRWGANLFLFDKNGYSLIRLSVEKDSMYQDTIFLSDLGVEKDRRGEGRGWKILKEAIYAAHICGAKDVRLSCEKDAWQLDWYKRIGFVEIGTDEYDRITMRMVL